MPNSSSMSVISVTVATESQSSILVEVADSTCDSLNPGKTAAKHLTRRARVSFMNPTPRLDEKAWGKQRQNQPLKSTRQIPELLLEFQIGIASLDHSGESQHS